MAKQQLSLKQLAINKDSTAIIISVALASFVVIFSIVASNALLKQRAYQSRVISKKKVALEQLKKNVKEVESLKESYEAFSNEPENILKGSSSGTGERDGENPRLVLDALPSKYDFPGLTSSLEKVFKDYKIESLVGIDDEVAQSTAAASSEPTSIDMPFSLTTTSSFEQSKDVLKLYERSIRPIQVTKLRLEVASSSLKINVDGKTYFQPQKKFDVKLEKMTK